MSILHHVELTAFMMFAAMLSAILPLNKILARATVIAVIAVTIVVAVSFLCRSDVWSAVAGNDTHIGIKAVCGIVLCVFNLWLASFIGKIAWDTRKNAPRHHPDYPPAKL